MVSINKEKKFIDNLLDNEVTARRFGTPSDIVQAIEFLLKCGDFVQGQIINIDGGQLRGVY